MTSNQSVSKLLPPENPKSRVFSGTPGEWQRQTANAFTEVADSLALLASADGTRLSSIPDMWARPLLVEMVLQQEDHPLRPQIKREWKGMLAAFALAEAQGFPLKAKLLDLDEKKGDRFIGALLQLIPAAEKSLYRLNGKNPWEEIYIFLLKGRPVGMTSPSTLICPAEAADWTGIPWGAKSSLNSPIDPEDCLTDDEKVQLWHWLKDLDRELQNHPGDSGKIGAIVR